MTRFSAPTRSVGAAVWIPRAPPVSGESVRLTLRASGSISGFGLDVEGRGEALAASGGVRPLWLEVSRPPSINCLSSLLLLPLWADTLALAQVVLRKQPLSMDTDTGGSGRPTTIESRLHLIDDELRVRGGLRAKAEVGRIPQGGIECRFVQLEGSLGVDIERREPTLCRCGDGPLTETGALRPAALGTWTLGLGEGDEVLAMVGAHVYGGR